MNIGFNPTLSWKLREMALLVCATMLMVGAYSVLAANTTYYVDCSTGSNGSGTQASPWNNLSTVNNTTFGAGDQILFKRGTTCSGQLWPKGSGSSSSPATIGDYGSGALPIINGGTGQSAIKLYNQEYWHIQNIETTGGNPFGIYIAGDLTTVLDHFRITNVVVHDVGGTANDKETGLIVITPEAAGTTFNDVIIDGATVYNTGQWSGIMVGGDDFGRTKTSPRSTNIIIRNSIAHHVAGDGIVLYQVNNGSIVNNVAYETGLITTDAVGTPNAIWQWMCGNCVVEFNEAYLNHSPTYDGGAFDIDFGSDDNIVQYNYAHDNDAYCIAVFATGGAGSPTKNSIVRYNICSNNAREASLSTNRNAEIYLAVWNSNGGDGYIENLDVYNNTIYWNPANTTAHYAIGMYNNLFRGKGFSGTNRFRNNIIYGNNPNMINMLNTVGLTFDYNIYWNTGSASPVFRWGNTTYTGFTNFQNGTGQEAHGMYADPLLNSPTYNGIGRPTTQFTLQSNSPAVNAGVSLSGMGSRDFFGNSIPQGAAIDIGAHESGGSGPSPTNTPTNTPVGPTNTPTNTPIGPTNTPTQTPTPSSSTLMHVQETYTTNSSGTPTDSFSRGNTVYWRVRILDQNGAAVSGASVTTQLINPSGSVVKTYNATTDSNGWALFSHKTVNPNPTGTYTINVTGVSKSGATYDSGANVDATHQFSLN